jgi:hypothetical protein
VRAPLAGEQLAQVDLPHPAVRAHPYYFHPDGLASDELPTAEIQVPQYEPELNPPHRKVLESEQVVAVTGFAELSTGRSVKKGQLVARSDP